MVCGGSGCSDGMRRLLVLILLALAPEGLSAQQSTAALDLARRQPIVDGQGLAGIRLGDTEEAVMAKLGGLPWKTTTSSDGWRRSHLYVAMSSADEGMTIEVTFTLEEARAEAITLRSGRQPNRQYSYEGRTTRGYRLGEPKDRLRAVYGMPDEVIPSFAGSDELWWYRGAGLVAFPGEKTIQGTHETRLTVVRPNLTSEQMRRLVLGP